MKIIVENSSWNNIGNAWFSFSAIFLLKSMYPQHEVVMGESNICGSFRVHNKQERNNAFKLYEYQRADIHVFCGPMMDLLTKDYRKTIEELTRRKEKYCLISASGTSMSSEEISATREFMQKYPPLFFSSRDEYTYNTFKDYVPVAYNGICTAFLCGRTIQVSAFKMEKPFFISSFYMELEPTFSVEEGKESNIENIKVKRHPTMYRLPFWISRHLNYKREQQREVGGKIIVRTIQNLNTRFNHINFAMPNSFISFNPLSYLEIVKSSEFTISDRVHACAVSLAMNHPARFMFNTPRAGIFDRMGFDYKSNRGIMYPNMEKVDEEMYKLQEQIRKYVL